VQTSHDLTEVVLQSILPTPAAPRPRLDEDGILWVGRRWVVIPDAQLGVVELLLSHPNELVRTNTVVTTYMRGGSSGHPASVRTMLHRVVRRFAEVGLTLHVVRFKGVILELAD
jgi:hypothetical protein